MADIRAHLEISGLVQGVYFRYSASEEAAGLGVTGWVRNLPNGNVEAVIEGEEAKVEQMIKWCGRGPAPARVDKVEVKRLPATGEFSAFKITY